MVAIALGYVVLRAYLYYRGINDSHNLKFWAYALLFLEFVLSGVSTVGTCPAEPLIARSSRFVTASPLLRSPVCKTFVCQHFDGQGEVLVAQPTLSCHNTPNRVFWEWYASIMVLVYPVGVPTLFFVMLHLQRHKIKRVMLVQKALEDGRVPQYDKTMSKEEVDHTQELYDIVLRDHEKEDITIENIAHADSMKLRSESKSADTSHSPEVEQNSNVSDWRTNLMHLARQFKSAQTLQNEEGLAISPLLLAMQQYFEKYEGHMYW